MINSNSEGVRRLSRDKSLVLSRLPWVLEAASFARRLVPLLSDPYVVISVIGASALLAAVVAANLRLINKRTLDDAAAAVLELEPSKLTATLSPEVRSEPRGGEVQFKVNFADVGPGGARIAARFRWSNGPEQSDWLPSPAVRLVGRNEESIDGKIQRTITAAAIVPTLPASAHLPDWSHRPLEFKEIMTGLGLWRSADMQVYVTKDELLLLDTTFTLLISDRGIAAGIVLVPLIAILSLWLLGFRSVRVQKINLLEFQCVLWTLEIAGALGYFLLLIQRGDLPYSVVTAFSVVMITPLGTVLLTPPRATGEEKLKVSKKSSRSRVRRDKAGPILLGVKRVKLSVLDTLHLIAPNGKVESHHALLLGSTLVAATIFAVDVALDNQMPGISTPILGLLGISNGLFLLPALLKRPSVSAAALEAGIRGALSAPKLVGYHGYLTFYIPPKKRKRTISRLQHVPPDQSDGQMERPSPGMHLPAVKEATNTVRACVQFLPKTKRRFKLSIRVDGDTDKDAVFDIELLGDEVSASPSTIQLVARTGTPSRKQYISLNMPEDGAQPSLRLYVTQAGRYLGVLDVPVSDTRPEEQ